MPIYEMPNLTAGMDDAIVGTATAVPSFVPMLLVFVFGVVFISGMLSQRRRTGTADAPMWSVIACLATLLVALPMTITSGIINVYTLSVVVVLTIFAGFWFFLDRNRNEV